MQGIQAVQGQVPYLSERDALPPGEHNIGSSVWLLRDTVSCTGEHRQTLESLEGIMDVIHAEVGVARTICG